MHDEIWIITIVRVSTDGNFAYTNSIWTKKNDVERYQALALKESSKWDGKTHVLISHHPNYLNVHFDIKDPLSDSNNVNLGKY